jgi:hypothetical protein
MNKKIKKIKGLKILKGEKGIALMMVLVLSTIALAIMAGMIYMITQSTVMSGLEKRYNTSLEAGKAGAEVAFEIIGNRGLSGLPVTLTKSLDEPCLTDKLTKDTEDWNAICNSSPFINPDDASTYDISFNFGSYDVYSKIVDTVEGNSAPDIGLLKTGVVLPNAGEITPKSVPYLYTIEINSQHESNPAERAKVSVLYQY